MSVNPPAVPLTRSPPLDFTPPQVASDPKVDVQVLRNYGVDELALLQVLVLSDLKNQKELALSLAYDLLKSKDLNVQNQGRYLYAQFLHADGIHTEAERQLETLAEQSNPTWAKAGAEMLIARAQDKDYDRSEQYRLWLAKSGGDSQTVAPQYFYNLARLQSEKGEFREALNNLEKVDATSEHSDRARHLRTTILYRLGDLKGAIENEAGLLNDIQLSHADSDLKGAVALLLARLYFQDSDYVNAYKTYLVVDRKTPDWPEAQVESAWSQILAKDYEGAAGNMFTLHTDFFKNTFAPESYLVRTVGYVNLCQYGDGLQVINDMNQTYGATFLKMKEFSIHHDQSADYYSAVRGMLGNVHEKEFEGIPRNLFYDIARNPAFKFYQGTINALVDETESLNKLTLKVIDLERHELEKPEKNMNLLAVFKHARENLKMMRRALIPTIDALKSKHKMLAAAALKQEFDKAKVTLEHSLSQVEVLKYEIYSGAGEQLRFTASGGTLTAKDQSHPLVPETSESMKWKFKGEIWEDELGHYRSNLKNVCPQT